MVGSKLSQVQNANQIRIQDGEQHNHHLLVVISVYVGQNINDLFCDDSWVDLAKITSVRKEGFAPANGCHGTNVQPRMFSHERSFTLYNSETNILDHINHFRGTL